MRGPVVPPLDPGEAPAATSDLRLRGYWLLIARFAWVMVALACLAVIVGSIRIDLGLLQTACAGASCVEAQQRTASGAKVLNQVGLSLDTYGVLSLSVTVLAACVWFGAALVIVWRKSDEWVALLVAGMLVLQGTNTIISPAQEVPSFWQFPATFLSCLGFVLIFLALLLFPDGRFRPCWTRWLVIVWAVSLWFGYFVTFPQALLPFFVLLWASLFLCLLIIQIYRYRRVYTQVQRQQTKWVVLGAGAVLLFEIADAVSVVVFPAFSQSASLSGLLVAYASVFIPVLLPLSISIALLRYRLWDVDALINETLVYALLSALLGTLYAVLIIGL
jgi:hypothetical protein